MWLAKDHPACFMAQCVDLNLDFPGLTPKLSYYLGCLSLSNLLEQQGELEGIISRSRGSVMLQSYSHLGVSPIDYRVYIYFGVDMNRIGL